MGAESVLDLPPWFDSFLALGADRHGILADALKHSGVRFSSVELAGTRSIIVAPDNPDRRYRLKLISAHYDRVPGTPGALDNSAACVQLWKLATSDAESFNTICAFTDNEELVDGDATKQGSYALGLALGTLGYSRPLAITLDVCGRGDTIVFSTAAKSIDNRPVKTALAARDACSAVDQLVRLMAGRGRCCATALPYGEDLGYLLAGVPAVAVTVLPSCEAQALAGEENLPPWASLRQPGTRMPYSWSTLHGPDDLPSLYTSQAFILMEKFLHRFAAWKCEAWL